MDVKKPLILSGAVCRCLGCFDHLVATLPTQKTKVNAFFENFHFLATHRVWIEHHSMVY